MNVEGMWINMVGKKSSFGLFIVKKKTSFENAVIWMKCIHACILTHTHLSSSEVVPNCLDSLLSHSPSLGQL